MGVGAGGGEADSGGACAKANSLSHAVGGPSQSAGVGWTWKVRLLSEDFRSPAVWAALCGGFPGAERHDEKSTRTGECSKRGWETRPALGNPRAASLSIH